ncbi:MAG TPA: hypothetical protein DFS52_08610 [Myxococcales bacterium]|nr:hypothetical protein [Myxococcales bacterium]
MILESFGCLLSGGAELSLELEARRGPASLVIFGAVALIGGALPRHVRAARLSVRPGGVQQPIERSLATGFVLGRGEARRLPFLLDLPADGTGELVGAIAEVQVRGSRDPRDGCVD